MLKYSRTPEIKTADCLNLTPVSICLHFRLIVYFIEIQVPTAILNYLKIIESILGIVTILTNEK